MCELGGISADHVERLDLDSVHAMAAAGVTAVLLPGAQLYLKDTAPPVTMLREAGVPMAVATDFNPGSSPFHDIWTCASLACVMQGLTVEEAVLGITRVAGQALGRHELGWLGKGSAADLALFSPPPGEPPFVESMIQHIGGHDLITVIKNGRELGGTIEA